MAILTFFMPFEHDWRKPMIFPVITEQEKLLPVYIKGIGIQANQEYTDRKDGYKEYQWTLCTQGKGIFKIGGKEYMLERGMGFFFSPYIPHSYYALEEPWETCWITFEGTGVNGLLHVYNINPFEVFLPKDFSSALDQFHTAHQLLRDEKMNRVTDASAIIYGLLATLKKEEKLTYNLSNTVNKTEKLQPVIAYMEANFSRDIGLDSLASTIGVSTHYLCRLFKQSFGITPIHYLIRIRLQMAKQLLIQYPKYEINTIAQKVSYQDVSYFGRIFKQQEQMTPGEFRRIHGIY